MLPEGQDKVAPVVRRTMGLLRDPPDPAPVFEILLVFSQIIPVLGNLSLESLLIIVVLLHLLRKNDPYGRIGRARATGRQEEGVVYLALAVLL